jgi:hypothetical protein
MADDAPEPIADTAAFRAFSAGSDGDHTAEPAHRSSRLPLMIATAAAAVVVIVAIIIAL